MGLSVNKVFKFVQFVANKEHRGWVSPEEFNIAAEVAQLSLYSELEGLYSATKKISADLRPFRRTEECGNGTLSGDTGDIPEVRIPIQAWITGGETNEYSPVKIIEESEYPGIKTSSLIPSAASYPIMFLRIDTDTSQLPEIIVDPSTVSITLHYLTTPTPPEWDYTTTSGRPVYDDSGSTNFGFEDMSFMEISRRILGHVGINIKDELVTQYAASFNQRQQ